MELFFINVIFFKPSTMALAHDKKKNNCIEKNYKNTLLMATPLFFLARKKTYLAHNRVQGN
jgi:hypothetical protein